jgi:hypothetical protein
MKKVSNMCESFIQRKFLETGKWPKKVDAETNEVLEWSDSKVEEVAFVAPYC